MNERRTSTRKRVIYGAVAAQSDGRHVKCVVKNWSELGARVEFEEPIEMAEDLSLIVAQTGLSYRARVAWSRDNAAGLAFVSAPEAAYAPKEVDLKLQNAEKREQLLHRGVDELVAEG